MRRFLFGAFICLALGLAPLSADTPATKPIPDPTTAITKPGPESIDDLRAIQRQTRLIYEKVMPATVGLRVGAAQGSGVIINKEGLILTAGHVSGEPGKVIDVVLPDGKVVKGKSLGQNGRIDSGMAIITDKGDWPYVEMADPKSVKAGQWCIAIGHPGGYKPGRLPVVRVGKISSVQDNLIVTDCALVGGDSGGPLFDMKGNVIGIHSRIGPRMTDNIHVPMNVYKTDWDALVRGDKVGENDVWLGVRADASSKECKLGEITPNSPAEEAGLKAGDVIIKFDGKDIKTYEDMTTALYKRRAGDKIEIVVKREEKEITLKVTLGKRKN